MKNCFAVVFSIVILSACGGSTDTSSEEGEFNVTDFIALFPEKPLPFQLSEATLLRKHADSTAIAIPVFNQFVSDTVLSREFPDDKNLKIFPLARAAEKGKETYLFIKAMQGTKRVGYLLAFDKKNNFVNAMPLVKPSTEKNAKAYGSLDNKFQITTYRERKLANGETSFKRNVYIYNSGGNIFNLILTEPNEEMIEHLYNPIDTFPRKHKLAGDYLKNEENIISFRDGRKSNELLFFVHFEKDKSTCNGELKGTATLVGANVARYKANGNPCTLEFTFTPNAVSMKETAGCGTYRGIKCFFEGTYPRKKIKKGKKV
jgi:hypothetical protein